MVGLLVLTGGFSDWRFASAPTRDECPFPASVTTSPELPVTAQQVDNGSASLMAFALAAARLDVGAGRRFPASRWTPR